MLNHVQLFVTPWTTALQTPLSFTISQSLLRFVSIELVMLSNHSFPQHLVGNLARELVLAWVGLEPRAQSPVPRAGGSRLMPDPSPEAGESSCWAASVSSTTRAMLAPGVELGTGAPKELTIIAKSINVQKFSVCGAKLLCVIFFSK